MALDTSVEIDPQLVTDILRHMPQSPPPEPKEGDPKSNKLTPSQIRYSSEDAVRQEVVLGLQDKKPFDKDTVSSLFAREQEAFLKDVYRTKEVTWPDTATEKPTTLLGIVKHPDGKPYIYTANVDGKQISSAEVTYLPEKDALARESFKTLSLDEKKDVFSYLVKIRYVYPKKLVEDIAGSEKDKSEIMTHLMHTLYENKTAYTYPNHDFAKDNWTKDNIDPIVSAVASTISSEDIVKAIIEQPEEEQLATAAIFVDAKSFAQVINGVRKLWGDETISKEKVEQLGRLLLQLHPEQPFYESLNKVYEQLEFSHYETNDHATDFDVALMINTVLPQLPDNAVFADLGCGTARTEIALAKALAQKHITKIKKMYALDNSPKNLATGAEAFAAMKKEIEENDMRVPEITFVQGDFNDATTLAPYKGKIHFAISTGRTWPHTEDIYRFMDTLDPMLDTLTEEGLFLVDLPDPNKGAYRENRLQSLALLQKAGVPIKDTEQHGVEYVVDSANGKDRYNRYIPQFSTVKNILDTKGYTFEEIARAPIVGDLWENSKTGEQSENVYFLIKRKQPHALAA